MNVQTLVIVALSLLLLSCRMPATEQSTAGQETVNQQPLADVKREPRGARPSRFPNAATVQIFYESSESLAGNPSHNNLIAGPRLNTQQRRDLEAAIFFRQTDPDEAMDACFVPHHFFQYLDAAGRKVGEVSVCFCCEGVSISGENFQNPETDTEIIDADYAQISNIVKRLGVPTDLGCE